jgi:NaMN:DMB phosphoribosyltransferase
MTLRSKFPALPSSSAAAVAAASPETAAPFAPGPPGAELPGERATSSDEDETPLEELEELEEAESPQAERVVTSNSSAGNTTIALAATRSLTLSITNILLTVALFGSVLREQPGLP